MKVWRPSSLQWRLTLSLLAVTGLVWTLVLVMTWLKTEHELSELLDAHLAQTAAVLAVQTAPATSLDAGSGGTVTYFNGQTWDNTMRLAGRFATGLTAVTTTNYTNYTNAGCKFPSQYQFLGVSVWSTRDDLYSPISTAWDAIRTFNGAP